MKSMLYDLKSFVTVAMILLLAGIVIANIFGMKLDDNILILVKNLITSVFTYYFTKKEDNVKNDENAEKVGNESILPKE